MVPNDIDLTVKDWIVGVLVVIVIIATMIVYYVYGISYISSLIIGIPIEFQTIIVQVLEFIPIMLIMIFLIFQPMWLIGRIR